MGDRLILFTRYPIPGQAKTRLIPTLGQMAAADLHRQMTEHTLAQVRQLQSHYPLTVEVRFTGADVTTMQAWLGADLLYSLQTEGDLGDRMAQALRFAFSHPVERVIIIGSDCPNLTASVLLEAFQALRQTDLVLGPTTDGGYYLIGMRRFVPDLFQAIAWSTDQVFAQTVEIAQRLTLSFTTLPALTDVDRPADLSVWHRVIGLKSTPQPVTMDSCLLTPIIPEQRSPHA